MANQQMNNELTLEQLDQVSGGTEITMTFERVLPDYTSQISTDREWKYIGIRRF